MLFGTVGVQNRAVMFPIYLEDLGLAKTGEGVHYEEWKQENKVESWQGHRQGYNWPDHRKYTWGNSEKRLPRSEE